MTLQETALLLQSSGFRPKWNCCLVLWEFPPSFRYAPTLSEMPIHSSTCTSQTKAYLYTSSFSYQPLDRSLCLPHIWCRFVWDDPLHWCSSLTTTHLRTNKNNYPFTQANTGDYDLMVYQWQTAFPRIMDADVKQDRGKLFSHALSLVTQITWASISCLIHRLKKIKNKLHSQYLHPPQLSGGRQSQSTKPLKN